MKTEARAKRHQDVKNWSLRPRIEVKRALNEGRMLTDGYIMYAKKD